MLFYVSKTMGEIVGNETFKALTPKVKAEYHSRVISSFHGTIAFVLAYLSVWQSCDDPSQSIFSSDACIMKPKDVQLYLVIMSSAYCTYDLYICLFEIKYEWAEGFEFLFHHIVGVLGAAGVFYCGRFNVALSSGALLSEASNMLMNYRWFMLKHKATDHPLYMPTQAGFAISFFLSRIVFMLMMLIRNFQMHYVFDIFEQHWSFVVVQITTDAMLTLLYLLQVYWFKLIVNMVLRTLSGDPKKKKKTEASDATQQAKKD